MSTQITYLSRIEMYQGMMNKAFRHYWNLQKTSMKALRYLKERGVTQETAKLYGIGYADTGYQSLKLVFPNYQVPALQTIGLVGESNGRLYDRFRDRLMFPILSDSSKVVGFGGRIIDGSGPKYLNSPETPLFTKGTMLFGVPQAIDAIAATGEVIVVEGYLDVVIAAQYGVRNVVATLGTATTRSHVQKLMSLASKNIYFCFDGDAAGKKAAVKAMETCLGLVRSNGARIYFAFVPSPEDPDSYLRKFGADAFKELLSAAKPMEMFIIHHAADGLNIDDIGDLPMFGYRSMQYLSQIVDAELFYRVAERVAEILDYSVAEVICYMPEGVDRSWADDSSLPNADQPVAPEQPTKLEQLTQ